jgi:hypothetical protein
MLDRDGLMRYFSVDKEGQEKYIHDSPLYARVFKKYEDLGLFSQVTYVEVLGILDMEIDGVHYGLNIPAKIRMWPTHVDYEELDGTPYIKMTFFKGDIFRLTNRIIKDSSLPEKYYKLFVFEGARYPWMTVNNAPRIFDNTHLNNFGTPNLHKVLYSLKFSEVTYAGETNTLFRNSDLKGPARVYGLKELRKTAKQWLTKTSGSYLRDTKKAALVTTHETSSELEDMLRM